MNKPEPRHIYWQKQGGDMLCAVHTVNSILQGPFFDEIVLAQIAQQLDRKEKELMEEQGVTKDFLKYMKEESGNVALSGNYSIQVLVEALKTHGLKMVPINTLEKNVDLTSKEAFICNSEAHWFGIRRIEGVWYNLNSTNKRLPEIISDFYLAAFLDSVKQSGYQIFSVEGEKFPESNEDLFEQYNPHQMWLPAKRIQKYHEKRSKRKGYRPNISGAGNDDEMQKAIAASLGTKYEKQISSGEDSDWDLPQGAKKPIKEFAGNAAKLSEGNVYVNYDKFQYSPEDYEIIFSIRSSLEEAFKHEPSKGISVALRYPNGKKQRRNFEDNCLVETLYDYVWMNRDPNHQFYLVNGESKQRLIDGSIPLCVLAGEDGSVTVFVTDMQ